MARSKNTDGIDDIELLNIHRYPESVTPSVLAFVRNSRACQKRLEELLKVMPARPRGRRNIDILLPLGESESAATEPETPSRPAAERPTFWQRLLSSIKT
ncbi:MAG: hypothetical protein HS115_01055 [Spirochaetales bacterium]|nr:hypothetical protein [Spirochaetales bacterium]